MASVEFTNLDHKMRSNRQKNREEAPSKMIDSFGKRNCRLAARRMAFLRLAFPEALSTAQKHLSHRGLLECLRVERTLRHLEHQVAISGRLFADRNLATNNLPAITPANGGSECVIRSIHCAVDASNSNCIGLIMRDH